MENSHLGHFFAFTDFWFDAMFSRPLRPTLRFCFGRVDMLGLWARSDDLNVVLFEFLDDDTKLAQSCTDWLYVQHWYTIVPEPSMRVTLWALMGVGDDCDKRTEDTRLVQFSVFCLVLSEKAARHVLEGEPCSARGQHAPAVHQAVLAHG